MASISDFILSQAKSAIGGAAEVPSNLKEKVLGGLSDSIIGSLTQTAAKAGGLEQVKSLLTGKTAAASSPITALAGNLFTNNVIKKLGLNSSLSSLVPSVMGKLSGFLKDQDGDGDVDITDIMIALKGGSASKGSSLLGALGGLLKKK